MISYMLHIVANLNQDYEIIYNTRQWWDQIEKNKQEGIIYNGVSNEASAPVHSLMNLHICSGWALGVAQSYPWATLKGKQNQI